MSPDEIEARFPNAVEPPGPPTTVESTVVTESPPPTRAQVAGRLLRETLIVVLAFVGGAGAFLFAIDRDPLRWQDWAGTAAAGSVAALAKMFPTAGGVGGKG